MGFAYPNEANLRLFIELITNEKYNVSKYLPLIDEQWYQIIGDCVQYVEHTQQYLPESTIHECAARLLYKIAKRHELGDGNKRSAVMATYLFYVVNDYMVFTPKTLKDLARRAARTKGRDNEPLLHKRIAECLANEVRHKTNLI